MCVPAVNPKIVSCCEGSHGRLGGFTFKYAEEPAGRKGNCPSYRVGRRRALDELENVYPAIKQFDRVVLKAPKAGGNSPGFLKVMVVVRRCDEHSHDFDRRLSRNQSVVVEAASTLAPSKIELTHVTVRLYAVRAFRLISKVIFCQTPYTRNSV